MEEKVLNFSRIDKAKFFRTLNKRVNSYFKENNIKKTGNGKLYFKTAVFLTLFILPIVLMYFIKMPLWVMLLLCAVVGFGMAGVGMNVMHDSIHEAFSSRKWVNKIFGSTIYVMAGNVYNWQVQHNVLHHTYTNVHGHDDDISTGGIMRFTKHEKWRWIYRLQQIYSVFLYGLLTINWALVVDFKKMRNYLKRKLSYGASVNPRKQWTILVITKVIYYIIWIVLPLVFMDITFWQWLIGFFAMHYTAGIILSLIFQLAHVVPNVEMPIPDKDGNLEHTWAIHQLYTTCNFAPKNKFISWYTGGLNHQVEHHIFPNISHIHYGKISKIVKETAKEFNLPYHEYKSMRSALIEHFKQLYELGKKPSYAS